MNSLAPVQPEPDQPVTVRHHRVDWEADDLAEITARRAMDLGPRLQQGCWYLTPRYTASSPTPTAEFFAKIRELRSTWLRTCRQIQGPSGQRLLGRQAVREGRLGAGLEIATAPHPHRRRETILLRDLPADQRRDVVEAGQVARQLAFSGIMFIDGEHVPPRTWNQTADELLGPEPLARGGPARRVAPATFQCTAKPCRSIPTNDRPDRRAKG